MRATLPCDGMQAPAAAQVLAANQPSKASVLPKRMVLLLGFYYLNTSVYLSDDKQDLLINLYGGTVGACGVHCVQNPDAIAMLFLGHDI